MPVTRSGRRTMLVAAFIASSAAAQSDNLREISAQHIDLRNGGVRAKADWVRYKLVEVNGPTGGYVLAAGHGNPAGYLGAINELIGPESLGAVLAQAGISECSQIPTSGELSRELSIDGETERLTAWFGAGNREIPAHFEQGGTRFDKHVVLAEGDERVLELQLSCRAGESLVSGYAWQTPASSGERGKEVYFQQDPARGLSRVDMHYTHPPSGEHVAFRFATESGDLVRIWAVRSMLTGDSSGFAVAYAPATGAAMTSFLMGQLPPTDTTRFSDGSLECLNLNTNAADASCAAAGLVITEPVATALVSNQSHSFSIAGITQMEVRQGVPELPTPGDPAPAPDAGTPDAAALEADAGGQVVTD